MIHSMLFFWHRYELPAVALGIVSVEHPRMGSSMSSFQGEERGRYEPPAPSVAQPPPVPSIASPPHQLVRQLSHGTAASRTSRQASSTALFNDGEDGDESYIYFMGGEVVMHREDRRAPLPTAPPTDDVPRRVGGIPDHILAEVGVLHHNNDNNNTATSTHSFDAMDNDDELFHSFEDEQTGRGDAQLQSDGGGAVIVDAPETSALQAILHVHETPRNDIVDAPETSALEAILNVHGTPRTDNRSEREETADNMAATAPIFPFHA
jgi:hypothetical protein